MIEFLSANWEAIVSAFLAVHVAALAIVNLTPTPKDNEVLAKIYPWVERLAGLISKRTKD